MKTVGVVIPIYNVEKYLKECLDSVINQTYTNLEIILINDGSTDENSLSIAKEYTLKDKRITLFDKKNGGLSSARNVGIEYFSGEYKLKNKTQTLKENSLIEFNLEDNNPYEIYTVYKSYKAFNNEQDLINFTYPHIDYIIFLDSDDYWELNCIEECVPRMDGVEVVWFDWRFHYETKNIKFENLTYHDRYNFKQGTITPLDWLNQYENTRITWFSFAWNGMVDFKHLATYKLHFINQTIHEDVFFGISLFLSCNFISYLPYKLYNYRIRDNSLCDYSNQNTNTWISPYMKSIYNKFNNIEQTKFYHRISSEALTCIELLFFIENKIINKYSDISLKKLLNDRISALWMILDCDKDPLNILDKIPKKLYIEKVLSSKKIIKNLNEILINKETIIISQNNQISNLNKILQDKDKLLTVKENLLNLQTHHGTAKSRIQNQLSYKLGQALIINSKSILGFLSLPFIILSIIISHKQEQKAYKIKIKKNPNLILPPLENYPDYKEVLKEKECFTYKLGEALIRANKTWYKGGYVKFYFKDIPKLKRDFRQKR
ncbi:glycosyltransferase family 2 protein [Campylobacter coli]|nr:glycosyltransferase family 2 protein [Campylobacter coli]EGP7860548.1 glycosyltransferase family 2 protein [Campylobacter jejuni]